MMRWLLLFICLMGSAHAESVLMIGDSHSVGAFGETLFKALNKRYGQNVVLEASWGSAPRTWTEGNGGAHYVHRSGDRGVIRKKPAKSIPTLNSLIEKNKPTVSVIALGSNYYQASPDWIKETMEKFMAEIEASGSQCIWVGPPDMRSRGGEDARKMVTEIKKYLNGCEFIDSMDLTAYPAKGGDGIHYDHTSPDGNKKAIDWAIAVDKQIHDRVEKAKLCDDSLPKLNGSSDLLDVKEMLKDL